MKYDYSFKMNCVELYKSGRWAETPTGIGQKNFRKRIVVWAKIAELHGFDALRHPSTCTMRTAEERYALVARVLAGESQKSVEISVGISSGVLSKWVKCYKIYGYDGLKMKKGRPCKEKTMKKDNLPTELNPSEREELIRLRFRMQRHGSYSFKRKAEVLVQSVPFVVSCDQLFSWRWMMMLFARIHLDLSWQQLFTMTA